LSFNSVKGEKSDHKVVLYALSTCGWCKKTREFLEENSVAYDFIYVDKASFEEKKEISMILQEKGVPLGFPITFIDHETIISGYKPDDIKEALEL
jgi:glutaredoxin